MYEINLEKEENEFFKEWIKKEWICHNQFNKLYQLDLDADITFEENEFYYKIMKNEEMIGFVGLILKDDELFNSHILYLYRLYINNEYRNLGIGTKVMEKLIEIAKQMKRDIELECFGNNPAIHLYKRMGFEENYRNMILKLN